jgi:hypothetical protein
MQAFNGVKEFCQSFGFKAYFESFQVNGQVPIDLGGPANPLLREDAQNCIRVPILPAELNPLLYGPRGLTDTIDRPAKVA